MSCVLQNISTSTLENIPKHGSNDEIEAHGFANHTQKIKHKEKPIITLNETCVIAQTITIEHH
jgi:hypothetical protein